MATVQDVMYQGIVPTPYIQKRTQELLNTIFGIKPTEGYGGSIGKPNEIRTAVFIDKDGDGVDDRDQIGPGQPIGYTGVGLIEKPRDIPAQQVAGFTPVQEAISGAANEAAANVGASSLGLGAFEPYMQ